MAISLIQVSQVALKLGDIVESPWVKLLSLCRKIPMLAMIRPSIVNLNTHRAEVITRFSPLTKNHVGSMYFGALCAGSEVTAGLLALHVADKRNAKVVILFKAVKGNFLRRATSDVVFVCEDGEPLTNAVVTAVTRKERVNLWVMVHGYAEERGKQVKVTEFELEVSIKAT